MMLIRQLIRPTPTQVRQSLKNGRTVWSDVGGKSFGSLWIKTMTTKLLATAAAAMLAAGAAQAQISDGVIKIGVLNDMSGLYADIAGPGSVTAAKMAVEDFGAAAKGMKVEIVGADHQNKPDIGSNVARSWIDVDKVDAIADVPTSSVALAINQIVRDKNKVFLNSGAATSDLTGKACSPMNFQFLVDTYALPKAGVQSLTKQGVKTYFFITVDYAFGAALQSEATKFIEAAGGKVVGSVKHPLGATDFSSYLLQAQSSRLEVRVKGRGASLGIICP